MGICPLAQLAKLACQVAVGAGRLAVDRAALRDGVYHLAPHEGQEDILNYVGLIALNHIWIGPNRTLDLSCDAVDADGVEAGVFHEAVLLAGGAEDGVVGGGREDANGALDRGQEGPRRPGTHFWR